MPALAQNLIVGILIALSVAYVLRRAYRHVRGTRTGCGCSTCPALKQAPAPSRSTSPRSTGEAPYQGGQKSE